MTDLFWLHQEEDALNMYAEYIECSCGKAAEWDCATCLDEYCGRCAESHILSRHDIGRMEP